MKKLTLALIAGLIVGAHFGAQAMNNEDTVYVDETYVPVVTPTVNAAEGVVEGTGRAVKGTVRGTGEILTGDPVGGTEEIVGETVRGAGEVIESAVALPFNILSGK